MSTPYNYRKFLQERQSTGTLSRTRVTRAIGKTPRESLPQRPKTQMSSPRDFNESKYQSLEFEVESLKDQNRLLREHLVLTESKYSVFMAESFGVSITSSFDTGNTSEKEIQREKVEQLNSLRAQSQDLDQKIIELNELLSQESLNDLQEQINDETKKLEIVEENCLQLQSHLDIITERINELLATHDYEDVDQQRSVLDTLHLRVKDEVDRHRMLKKVLINITDGTGLSDDTEELELELRAALRKLEARKDQYTELQIQQAKEIEGEKAKQILISSSNSDSLSDNSISDINIDIDSQTVRVGPFPSKVRRRAIAAALAHCGDVEKAELYSTEGSSPYYILARFHLKSSATAACKELDGTDMLGNIVRVVKEADSLLGDEEIPPSAHGLMQTQSQLHERDNLGTKPNSKGNSKENSKENESGSKGRKTKRRKVKKTAGEEDIPAVLPVHSPVKAFTDGDLPSCREIPDLEQPKESPPPIASEKVEIDSTATIERLSSMVEPGKDNPSESQKEDSSAQDSQKETHTSKAKVKSKQRKANNGSRVFVYNESSSEAVKPHLGIELSLFHEKEITPENQRLLEKALLGKQARTVVHRPEGLVRRDLERTSESASSGKDFPAPAEAAKGEQSAPESPFQLTEGPSDSRKETENAEEVPDAKSESNNLAKENKESDKEVEEKKAESTEKEIQSDKEKEENKSESDKQSENKEKEVNEKNEESENNNERTDLIKSQSEEKENKKSNKKSDSDKQTDNKEKETSDKEENNSEIEKNENDKIKSGSEERGNEELDEKELKKNNNEVFKEQSPSNASDNKEEFYEVSKKESESSSSSSNSSSSGSKKDPVVDSSDEGKKSERESEKEPKEQSPLKVEESNDNSEVPRTEERGMMIPNEEEGKKLEESKNEPEENEDKILSGGMREDLNKGEKEEKDEKEGDKEEEKEKEEKENVKPEKDEKDEEKNEEKEAEKENTEEKEEEKENDDKEEEENTEENEEKEEKDENDMKEEKEKEDVKQEKDDVKNEKEEKEEEKEKKENTEEKEEKEDNKEEEKEDVKQEKDGVKNEKEEKVASDLNKANELQKEEDPLNVPIPTSDNYSQGFGLSQLLAPVIDAAGVGEAEKNPKDKESKEENSDERENKGEFVPSSTDLTDLKEEEKEKTEEKRNESDKKEKQGAGPSSKLLTNLLASSSYYSTSEAHNNDDVVKKLINEAGDSMAKPNDSRSENNVDVVESESIPIDSDPDVVEE